MNGCLAELAPVLKIDDQAKVFCCNTNNGSTSRGSIKINPESISIPVIKLERSLPGCWRIRLGIRPGKRINGRCISQAPSTGPIPAKPVYIDIFPRSTNYLLFEIGPIKADTGYFSIVPGVTIRDHDLLLVAIMKIELALMYTRRNLE